jgi:hypothetical protein
LSLKIVFTVAEDDPKVFVDSMVNLRGVIASLGIDVHFRLLDRIFTTRLANEHNETTGGEVHDGRLDVREQALAEILKQQIVYDVAVELSTICDGISGNNSLGDNQVYFHLF